MYHRRPTVLSVLCALVAASLTVAAPASADDDHGSRVPKDPNRYVDLTQIDETSPPTAFKQVEPDARTDLPSGATLEVYTSVGDTEGGMDWRTINAFAYLVNSVPTGKQSYTTLFNSLYDGRDVRYDAATGRWEVENPTAVFAPTAAFINQANRYATEAERREHIHVLGAKKSLGKAFDNDSSLAQLVQAGYKSSRPKAVDYMECGGHGACVTFTGSRNLMHSKYAAFEQAYDSAGVLRDWVVFVTSSNLNGASGSKKTNTTLVMYGDQSAYDAVVDDIFGTKAKIATGTSVASAVASTRYDDAITVGPDGVINGLASDSGVTFYPSPRAAGAISGDAAVARTDAEATFLLDQVATGPKDDSCKLSLSHSLFNSTRAGMQSALGQLAGQGCDVRVLLGENSISDIVDGYFTMATDLRQVIDRVEFGNVHDKAFAYRDGATATVFGGSTNLSGTSLEYDELAFRVDDPGVTDAVLDHLDHIYGLAKGRVTWATPTSVRITPRGTAGDPIRIREGDSVNARTDVSPSNALVTNTAWASTDGTVAMVGPTGRITGVGEGSAIVTATITKPDDTTMTTQVHVEVSPDATTSSGGRTLADNPPTLTMERYQSPASSSASGTTDIVVTWGEGDKDYAGVVKLKYYSGGKWKTYGRWVHTDENGVGRISASFKGSKTWRAYGARLEGVYRDGEPIDDGTTGTAKTWSRGYSIVTVRSKSPSSTPRLYATNLNRSGEMTPMLISWKRSGTKKVRLQYKSGSRWKTYETYTIPSGSTQIFVGNRIRTTKYWRVATSTGPTKVSNRIRIKQS